MKNQTFSILRLLRPRQWVKNLALFAAVTFTGQLFNPAAVVPVVIGFIVFCGISSGTYIINDIIDRKKDKQHPFKKFRPIAHGDVNINFAILLAISLITMSLGLATFVNFGFLLLVLIYLVLQVSYSTFLKSIAVIDILVIAAGYILRVYAGEVASGFHISVWLLLTTISISLFLAIGKRRSELTLLSSAKIDNLAATRKALTHYSDGLLNVYASIFATSTFIAYALFTFLEVPRGINLAIFQDVFIIIPDAPLILQKKWLMLTIIPVVYGLMRYLQDIYEKNEGESPEKVLFADKPLLITIGIWIFMVIGIIYFLGG